MRVMCDMHICHERKCGRLFSKFEIAGIGADPLGGREEMLRQTYPEWYSLTVAKKKAHIPLVWLHSVADWCEKEAHRPKFTTRRPTERKFASHAGVC